MEDIEVITVMIENGLKFETKISAVTVDSYLVATIIKWSLRSTHFDIWDTINTFHLSGDSALSLTWRSQNANFWKIEQYKSRSVHLDSSTVSTHVSPSNWIQSITNRCLVRDRRGRGPRQQGADLPHNPSLTSFFLSLTPSLILSTVFTTHIKTIILHFLLNVVSFCT